jgi:hypothetical protein
VRGAFVDFRHVSCVKFLLNNGAEPFLVDKPQRRSAIHYAANGGQVGVLRALLSDTQLMHTEDGVLPLKNVRVHDMSGQCRCPLTPLVENESG